MRLPDLAHASAGKPLKLTIARPVEGKEAQTLEISVTPDDSIPWDDRVDSRGRQSPLDIPGLGLALAIEPNIAGVTEGSPASKAGLKPGQVLRSIVFAPKKRADVKSEPKPITIELNRNTSGWPIAFTILQQIPMKSIKLTVDESKTPVEITPDIDPQRFHIQRGLRFEYELTTDFPAQGISEAFRRGFEETVDDAINVVFIFRNLSQGRVGGGVFNGIGPITQVAYLTASAGWVPFIHFLGILSVNLAVLNFLPIPPLDGGQFLFLAAEKIRGKPLPESWLNSLMILGMVVVVALILFVNGKDLYLFIASYF
jgi:regulator of sigma E protease